MTEQNKMDELKGRMNELRKEYAQACEQVEKLAKVAGEKGLWQKNEYGKRLSDLYLRLKQGPVRAVVIGQTSSGKSTLFNALAGGIIAPEAASASSPIPLWMLWKDQKVITADNQVEQPNGLPKADVTNTNDILKRHHVTGMQTSKDGLVPYVYTGSPAMPRYATLVDSPGFNANGQDTDKALSLFNIPSYATKDAPDLPELVIYVQSLGDNLSDQEKDNIRLVMQKGVDLERIFLVHNEIRQSFEITKDTFETLNPRSYDGLKQSYISLAQPKSDGDSGVNPLPAEETGKSDNPFVHSEPELAAMRQAAEKAEAAEKAAAQAAEAHVLCVNAMIARLHYAGIYAPLAAMPTGVSQEERAHLLVLTNETTQDEIKKVCDDAMKEKGHADYKPMITLRDTIDAQALQLVDNPCLRYALKTVQAMGGELIEMLRQLGLEEVEPLEALRKDLQAIGKKMDDLDEKRNKFSKALGDELTTAVNARKKRYSLLKERMMPESADSSNDGRDNRIESGLPSVSMLWWLTDKFIDQAVKREIKKQYKQKKKQYEQVKAEFDRLYTFAALSQAQKPGELEIDVCRKVIQFINEKDMTQIVKKRNIETLANTYCTDIKQGSITEEEVKAINQRIKQENLLGEWIRKNDNFFLADPPVKDGSCVNLTDLVFSQNESRPREFETDLASAFGWLCGAAGPLQEDPGMPERVEALCKFVLPQHQDMLAFKPEKVFDEVVCPIIWDAVDYTVERNQKRLEERLAYLENNNFFGVRSYIADVEKAVQVWEKRIDKAVEKCRTEGGSQKEQIEQLKQELKEIEKGAEHGQGSV